MEKLTLETFRPFAREKKVLIVDKAAFSVKKLTTHLMGLGFVEENLHSTKGMEEAYDLIVRLRPSYVFSDYLIQGGNGFDLYRSIREVDAESQSSIFILVTADMGQMRVAQAAEEDIDHYVAKPYEEKDLWENIRRATELKIYPSEYRLKIETAKELIYKSFYEDAKKVLLEAVKMDDKPTLARYYLGHCESKLQDTKNAQYQWQQGIRMNEIHFKCRNGLYRELSAKGNLQEAYDHLGVLLQYFPANLERFAQAIHLAIKMQRFDDIDRYYEIFKELDHATKNENDYICAGLLIAAKHYLGQGNELKANKLIEKLFQITRLKTKYLTLVIETLYSFGLEESLPTLLKEFEEKDNDQFLIAQFIVDSLSLESHQKKARALELKNKKIHNFTVEKILYFALQNLGETSPAEKIKEEMASRWPERVGELDRGH